MRQLNISQENSRTLDVSWKSKDQEIANVAAGVREVTLIKPHRRKRVTFVREHHPDLPIRLVQHGLSDFDAGVGGTDDHLGVGDWDGNAVIGDWHENGPFDLPF